MKFSAGLIVFEIFLILSKTLRLRSGRQNICQVEPVETEF